MATLTFDVSDEFYAYFETFTERKKKAIINYAKDAMYSRAESEKVPNVETLKAFEEGDKGIGVIEYDSLEDLYRDLGI